MLIFMAVAIPAKANTVDECAGEKEGFERANCYLENNLADEYFNYVSTYYTEIKDEHDRYDPALGFRFMEAVALHGKHDYADLATEIYFWGLNADKVDPFQPLVEREINYLNVLLSPDEKVEFQKLLEQGDPKVFEKLRRFWKSRDVVISSDKNERLLEHWERIIHSKKNFTKNDSTVYGTDERGAIYIRLGEPNRIRTGRFGSATTEVRTKLYDLQNRGYISSSGSVMHNMQQEILTSVIPAEYELWYYDDVSDRDNEHIFFLFGRKEGDGSFGLRSSVEEFIPQEVFSKSLGKRSSGTDIRIGNFLQFMYYSDLSSVHMFFGNQLQKYDRAWSEALRGGQINASFLRNTISRQRARDATESIYNAAPGDVSTYERRLHNYDLNVLEYRFLNEDGSPEHIYIVTSSPQHLIDDYGFIMGDQGQEISGQDYEMYLRQGISHYDHDYSWQNKNLIEADEHPPGGEVTDSNTSHTIVMDDSLDNHAVVFSELYYTVQGNENNPDTWSLIGVATDETDRRPALDYESGELILSDIVLGHPDKEKVGLRDQEIGILVNGNRITEGENFQVYFEAYHFEDSGGENSTYEVEYRITSSGKSWWPFSSSTEQSLAWGAATRDWYDYQFFEVEPLERDPGTYELHIEVTEKDTGRQAARSVEFEVIEKPAD